MLTIWKCCHYQCCQLPIFRRSLGTATLVLKTGTGNTGYWQQSSSPLYCNSTSTVKNRNDFSPPTFGVIINLTLPFTGPAEFTSTLSEPNPPSNVLFKRIILNYYDSFISLISEYAHAHLDRLICHNDQPSPCLVYALVHPDRWFSHIDRLLLSAEHVLAHLGR